MQKFLLFVFFVAIVIASVNFYFNFDSKKSSSSSNTKEDYSESLNERDETITNDSSQKAEISRRAVFVPYWSSMKNVSKTDEDRLLYFGISPTENGINTSETGYANLENFIDNTKGKDRWLTVRMLDQEINTAVLQDKSKWQHLATNIAQVAEQSNFDGVVLDLEVGLVAFHISPDSISGFTRSLKTELEKKNMPLAITVYGDTFYRKRPYNIKELGTIADELMIMAYDFHKSFGEAGPNFPLNGKEKYGYDFTTMVKDFTSQVPANKLTVIFGMYGYEWNVDAQGRPLKTAEAITVNQIKSKYLPICQESNCKVEDNVLSGEKKISFSEGNREHVIWYEDEESVSRKQRLLENAGISSIGFWAYGYY